MLSRSFHVHVLRLLLPASLLVLGGCQSEPEKPASAPASSSASSSELASAEISNEFTATAEVTAIAKAERIVTLRREDGSQFSIECGEAVRNFDQIAVGDKLRVRYKEILAATKLPAGEAARPMQGTIAAGSAKPGANPAAGVGVSANVRVKIESIDLERNVVVFSMASGEMIARSLKTPQGREFAKSLKVGDTVQLNYAQVLALSVEKL